MSFIKNRLVISILTILIVITIAIASLSFEILGYVVFFILPLIACAILFTITIPYMIWALCPNNKYKPLSKKWAIVGWIMLSLGYPPAILMIIEIFASGWNWKFYMIFPIILSPIFIHIVLKIKNRLIIDNRPLYEGPAGKSY